MIPHNSKLVCFENPVKMTNHNKDTSILGYRIIAAVISFIIQAPEASTLKHYESVMYRFRCNLMCLSVANGSD